MKLEIDVPEVTCCRCSKTVAIAPVTLKRAVGGNITDNAGNKWTSLGLMTPALWVPSPNDATKLLCPQCAERVRAAIDAALMPATPSDTPAARPPGANPIPSRAASTHPTERVVNTATLVQPNRVQPVPMAAAAGSTVVTVRNDLPKPVGGKVITSAPTLPTVNQSKELRLPSFAGGAPVEE